MKIIMLKRQALAKNLHLRQITTNTGQAKQEHYNKQAMHTR